jgi:hypothetical protein
MRESRRKPEETEKKYRKRLDGRLSSASVPQPQPPQSLFTTSSLDGFRSPQAQGCFVRLVSELKR